MCFQTWHPDMWSKAWSSVLAVDLWTMIQTCIRIQKDCQTTDASYHFMGLNHGPQKWKLRFDAGTFTSVFTWMILNSLKMPPGCSKVMRNKTLRAKSIKPVCFRQERRFYSANGIMLLYSGHIDTWIDVSSSPGTSCSEATLKGMLVCLGWSCWVCLRDIGFHCATGRNSQ